MTIQGPNLPARVAVAAVIGATIGIVLSAWWLTPKHSPEELRIAEIELRAKMHREDMAMNLAALEGRCKDGLVKPTPTGLVSACKGGRWTVPGVPELDKQLSLRAMADPTSTSAKP